MRGLPQGAENGELIGYRRLKQGVLVRHHKRERKGTALCLISPTRASIIDAHSHPDFHGHNFERSIENMDRNGIAAAWLLAWDTPRDEYDPNSIFAMALPVDDSAPNSFRLCWEYKQKAPDRFILGYAPDPRRPDSIQRMRSAIANYNVQVCGEIKLRMMYDNPDAIEMFRFCGENGLPITLHFDNAGAQRSRSAFPRPSWWYGGDIDTFERVLKPAETNFLVCPRLLVPYLE